MVSIEILILKFYIKRSIFILNSQHLSSVFLTTDKQQLFRLSGVCYNILMKHDFTKYVTGKAYDSLINVQLRYILTDENTV